MKQAAIPCFFRATASSVSISSTATFPSLARSLSCGDTHIKDSNGVSERLESLCPRNQVPSSSRRGEAPQHVPHRVFAEAGHELALVVGQHKAVLVENEAELVLLHKDVAAGDAFCLLVL